MYLSTQPNRARRAPRCFTWRPTSTSSTCPASTYPRTTCHIRFPHIRWSYPTPAYKLILITGIACRQTQTSIRIGISETSSGRFDQPNFTIHLQFQRAWEWRHVDRHISVRLGETETRWSLVKLTTLQFYFFATKYTY